MLIRRTDMKTLEERAKSTADWLYRRLPIPEVYNLPKMFADMLTEQRESDIEKAIKAHCSFCEAHNACVDRGVFCCPETEHIKKTMEE